VNRSYPAEYTQSTTNTWERATITITLDTTGTWLFTEADKGLKLIFALASGTDFTGTPEQWNAVNDKASSNIVNDMDNTSNNFAISQVGLYLGSTAPTFLGEPITTVINQVEYYVQRYNFDSVGSERTGINGPVWSSARIQGVFKYRRAVRIIPTITSSAAATFSGHDVGYAWALTSISWDEVGKQTAAMDVTTNNTNWNVGRFAMILRDGSDTTYITVDARH